MKSIKRFVVMAAGSGGDVMPMARIAARIVERGMPATLMAPARYRGLAEGTGVTFAPMGADDVFEEVFSGPDIWTAQKGLQASWRYYGAAMNASFSALRETYSPEDTALVSSSFAAGARLAEIVEGFTNTTVHLSPGVIFSAVSPPAWPAFSIPTSWPSWLKVPLVRAAERFGTDPVIGAHVNAALAREGKPDAQRLFSNWIHSPRRVIYAFPEWFAPPAADWPAQGVFADFPLNDAQTPMPEQLAAWLERSQDPLIVVTAGTAVEGRPAWVRAALSGARTCGARVVLIEPPCGESAHSDPKCISLSHAPFAQLLPKARLIVHHGGIGTFAQAVRSATPQIMVPTAHDQFDNAARAAKFGLAIRTSPHEWLKSPQKPLECALAGSGILANLHAFRARVPFNIDGVDIIAGCVVAECAAR